MIVSRSRARQRIRAMYRRLWLAWGAQGWWPGESAFEIMVGAILTQQTSWRNVERAIARLKAAGVLRAERLRRMSRRRLEHLVRPVGFFRVKTRRLRAFLEWFHDACGDSLQRFRGRPTAAARAALLSVPGIGPETADAMLLYAGERPIFVIDAYTRRIMSRHGLVSARTSYDETQQLVHEALPRDVQLYNEYHALLVRLGQTYCRAVPRCETCPLFPVPRVRGVWPTKKHRKPHHRV